MYVPPINLYSYNSAAVQLMRELMGVSRQLHKVGASKESRGIVENIGLRAFNQEITKEGMNVWEKE